MPASLGVAVPDWLRKGYELWRISVPFPRDYFLTRVSSDLSTFVPKLASTNDLSGMLNVVLKMLKVPVRDEDSGEVVESGVDFISADFTTGWTGHSKRSTVTSILAAVGFTKEDRAYLRRWASSSSEEYVRTERGVGGRVGGRRGEGVSVTHQHTRQHPHCAHQQHTQRTTHNTEHARCHRQLCLPKFAHVGLSLDPEVHQRNPWILPIFKFENKSRTTCSRFLQVFALHKACHAQPLSRSR